MADARRKKIRLSGQKPKIDAAFSPMNRQPIKNANVIAIRPILIPVLKQMAMEITIAAKQSSKIVVSFIIPSCNPLFSDVL